MPLCIAAAFLEIAGCFAVWRWWRGASALWVIPAALALGGFAWVLAIAPTPNQAGRSYAVYGGVHIATSVTWLLLVVRIRPDWADLAGADPVGAARLSYSMISMAF